MNRTLFTTLLRAAFLAIALQHSVRLHTTVAVASNCYSRRMLVRFWASVRSISNMHYAYFTALMIYSVLRSYLEYRLLVKAIYRIQYTLYSIHYTLYSIAVYSHHSIHIHSTFFTTRCPAPQWLYRWIMCCWPSGRFNFFAQFMAHKHLFILNWIWSKIPLFPWHSRIIITLKANSYFHKVRSPQHAARGTDLLIHTSVEVCDHSSMRTTHEQIYCFNGKLKFVQLSIFICAADWCCVEVWIGLWSLILHTNQVIPCHILLLYDILIF